MNYKLSKQVMGAKPTVIRKVYNYAYEHPDFLDLSIGEPAQETFPLEELTGSSAEVYKNIGKNALGYATYQGLPELIEEIRKWLIARGFDMSNDDIQILPGSGYGMDCMANTFCSEGDVIFTEMFAYPGIQNAARMTDAKLVGVKVDEDGINTEDLEKKASEYPNGKFLYLCPTFSNPTSITLSLEKRKAIYKIAQKYDLMIYEDDPYSMTRFAGDYIPEIKKLDTDGRVVYAGSFSKILAPGIRMGFAVCNNDLLPYIDMCQGNPGYNPTTTMWAVKYYFENYDIDKQCAKNSACYKEKADWAMHCIKKYLPEECKPIKPEGGLFMWLKVPETIDLEKTWDEIIQRNVGIVPSFGFSTDPENYPGSAFRLCFSTPSKETMEEACKILGEYFHEKIDE